ncbi:MAG: glycosyltransferase family 2 protein [Rhodopirellula sp.]|nr:glycosyltransferase family 2 protein [Rhodopirellula sp.]
MTDKLHWGSVLPAFLTGGGILAPARAEQYRFAPILPGKRQVVRCDVILPYCATNVRWALAAAESILNQAFAEPVLHLIADGDTAVEDRRLKDALGDVACCRWYRTRKRLGPYRITNHLFDYLETEYYVVQDADDLSAPNRLWRSVRVLEDHGYDIFGGAMEQFTDYRCRSEASVASLGRSPYQMPGVRWMKTPQGAIIHGGMTCRKSCFERLGGYGEFISGGDCEFIARAHAAGAKIFVSHQIVGWRRLHEDSLSHSMPVKLRLDEQFNPDEVKRRFEEWEEEGCDLASYGCLDRYRSGGELIRLGEGER